MISDIKNDKVQQMNADKFMWFSRNNLFEKWVNEVKEMKKNNQISNILSGKWLIFHEKKKLLLEIWKKLKQNENILLMKFVKNKIYNKSYLIHVYTSNYKNKTDLEEILKIIRSCGVDWKIYYKRDIETYFTKEKKSYYTSDDFEN